jgi:leucyl aminopeptidase
MFSEGIFLRNYSFNKYQSNKTKNQSLSINILLEKINSETLNEINKAKLISNNINIARDLVNETAEFLTPKKIAKFTKNISKTLPLIIDVLKNKELKQHNLNLILAVDRGSNKHSSARLIKIKYRSKHATNKQHICLIGKGVTFDSGGLNIKTTQNMYTMKSDMAGIATALGTILNIAQLKSNINVTAYLVCVENSIGPSSYHPGDIITSKSGLNVEISNTDAEGRLILADALTFAENEEQPDILIDIATLTGACVIALGNNTAGIFSNNKSLISDICKISKSTGESFWHMPLSNSLNDQLKSDIADIKNCGEPWGGAISASLFLQKFVKNKNNWCHIDIAGPAYSNKKYYYKPKGGTGFGIRTLTDFILHISNLN